MFSYRQSFSSIAHWQFQFHLSSDKGLISFFQGLPLPNERRVLCDKGSGNFLWIWRKALKSDKMQMSWDFWTLSSDFVDHSAWFTIYVSFHPRNSVLYEVCLLCVITYLATCVIYGYSETSFTPAQGDSIFREQPYRRHTHTHMCSPSSLVPGQLITHWESANLSQVHFIF